MAKSRQTPSMLDKFTWGRTLGFCTLAIGSAELATHLARPSNRQASLAVTTTTATAALVDGASHDRRIFVHLIFCVLPVSARHRVRLLRTVEISASLGNSGSKTAFRLFVCSLD